MPQLTPSQAAEIALGTYVLKSRTVSSVTTASSGLRAQGDNLLGIKDMFSANDQDQLHGTSGVPMFKQLTGFGYKIGRASCRERV